jgi:hypothetical protein
MNVRQYCGPRHRNARRCKIVRHSWLIFGRFGVRILIQRYWQVFVGLNTPIRKIIESASQATIASFHILSNSLFAGDQFILHRITSSAENVDVARVK